VGSTPAARTISYLTAAAKSARNESAVKFKNLFPGICLALLIVSEIFLFSANRQKDATLALLNESRRHAADLQSQLDQIESSNTVSESAETARLRAENQDLPRLRNQIQQLQAQNQTLSQQNQKLSQQSGAAQETIQQQQEQLQELQTENEQAIAAAQAQAQSAEQTEAAQRNACINNLREIYAAKQEWALENNKTIGDLPTAQDLAPYLPNGFPVCPSGGTYTIGAVGQLPTCSIPGHVLPQQ
jgi:methyl-accepting chemotaxis protein